MLAHSQGSLLNSSRLAGSLGVSVSTVSRYVDLLVDLLLVRRLTPSRPNVGKRLIKTPKVYVRAGFYRTRAGAEVDLVLHLPGEDAPWAIEVKLGLAPRPSRGLHSARVDLMPSRTFIVGSGEDRYPVAEGIDVIGLRELAGILGRGGR